MRFNIPLRCLAISLFTLAICYCGPDPTPTPEPQPDLGDTQTRPSDGMTMVYVPAGEFLMGSNDPAVEEALAQCEKYLSRCEPAYYQDEQPPHIVALDSFWLDQTEVTNAQYRECVEAGICDTPKCEDQSSDWSAPQHPVVCVTWHQARAYCEWVGGRLPTEAEWEYAARGPQGLTYPWANAFDGTRLNYCDAGCDQDWKDGTLNDGYAFTAPVGSYPAGRSWCGALDLAGNAWEWVEDWYADYVPGHQVNPRGPVSGELRAVRGGAWYASPPACRGAKRGWGGPTTSSNIAGFRCVVPVSP